MAGMVLGMIGLDRLLGQIEQIHAGMESKIDNAVQKAGLDCERYAKIACPVDSGNLRASLHHEKTGMFQCICGTNVPYSIFVEMGHHTRGGGSWVPAQPYLGPAYEQAKKELMARLRALNWSV